MFNKKNHVGRPSNEELKSRRNKKILMVAIPVVLVGIFSLLIATGSLSNLMGNSVTEYYCSDSSYTLEGTNCVKTVTKDASLLADVNLDGKVDNADLVTLNNYVSDENNTDFTEIQVKLADINRDNVVNKLDVQLLEGYFTKVSGTSGNVQETIGVERICEEGYTLNGAVCESKEIISADIKQNTSNKKDSDKEIESVGSNIDYVQAPIDYFTVYFNSNGATSGTMDSQYIKWGQGLALKKNTFLKYGYKFVGWKAERSNGTWLCYTNKNRTKYSWTYEGACLRYGYYIYSDQAFVSKTAERGKSVTMHAVWENNMFTISFNAGGGQGLMYSQQIEYGKSQKLYGNNFYKGGYKFVGWHAKRSDGKWLCYLDKAKSDYNWKDQSVCKNYGYYTYYNKQLVARTANPGQVVTMYAQWKFDGFTVYFDPGTSEIRDKKEQQISYGVSTPLKGNTFVRAGYKFIGWHAKRSDGTWLCYTNKSKTDYSWSNQSVCSRYGYYTYSDRQKVAKTAERGKSVTMYAQWKKSSFTVRYDGNKGIGSMPSDYVIYGHPTQLSLNRFYREGYEFVGWAAERSDGKWLCFESDGKSSSWSSKNKCEENGFDLYKNGSTVAKTAQPGQTVIMHAAWVSETDYSSIIKYFLIPFPWNFASF